ncbi:MAG: twin-arginine translocase TatA/TatE family subunit [Cystobacterineae bacterium]|nr:twin-arginine translocase TatA/TatE family subunit [Cystobacterineae bacterium]
MHLGIGEIVFLAIVLTLIFSASRMSALGNALGKFIHAFRKASQGEDFIDLPAQTTSPKEEQNTEPVKTTPQKPNLN